MPQDTIVSLQQERRFLQEELAIRRREAALMRNALVLCRTVIQNYQKEAKRFDCSRGRRLRFTNWAFVQSGYKRLPKNWSLPKKSDVLRYVVRSSLESLILLTATARTSGILGVIIEANKKPGRVNGANWHIAGIICGKADQSTAVEAVTHAVEQYAAWVAVDEGSHLNGRAIAEVMKD